MKPKRTTRRRLRIKTPRTSTLLIRLDPEALKALRKEAAAEDVSMSNLVSQAVAEHLERRTLDKLARAADALGAEMKP